MGILGWGLGGVMAAAVAWGVVAVPPFWGRWMAALALAAVLWVLLQVAFSADRLSQSFGAVYLGLGLLLGAVAALPRLRRWTGQEPLWVSLCMGLACVLGLVALGLLLDGLLTVMLRPEANAERGALKAVLSQAITNGLLLGGGLTVLALTVWPWPRGMR